MVAARVGAADLFDNVVGVKGNPKGPCAEAEILEIVPMAIPSRICVIRMVREVEADEAKIRPTPHGSQSIIIMIKIESWNMNYLLLQPAAVFSLRSYRSFASRTT